MKDHITLIGMSNIGKSYWSERLATEAGFVRDDCDYMAERKLEPELIKQGYKGLCDVAKWMGQPFAPQYAETSRKYLASERETMLEIIDGLRTERAGSRHVIDTSGSVIYVGDDVKEQLRALTRVVYLEAPLGHHAELFKRYIEKPKPVIWGDAYACADDEKPEAALARCYPNLLAERAARYKAMAHDIIPYERHNRYASDPLSVLNVERNPARKKIRYC